MSIVQRTVASAQARAGGSASGGARTGGRQIARMPAPRAAPSALFVRVRAAARDMFSPVKRGTTRMVSRTGVVWRMAPPPAPNCRRRALIKVSPLSPRTGTVIVRRIGRQNAASPNVGAFTAPRPCSGSWKDPGTIRNGPSGEGRTWHWHHGCTGEEWCRLPLPPPPRLVTRFIGICGPPGDSEYVNQCSNNRQMPSTACSPQMNAHCLPNNEHNTLPVTSAQTGVMPGGVCVCVCV